MPDLGWLLEANTQALLYASVFLFALTVYRLHPQIGTYLQNRSRRLTEENAQQAERIVKRVNGAIKALSLQDIERGLSESVWFREHVLLKGIGHRLTAIENEQQRFGAELRGHVDEDRIVHERVKALEVEMSSAKDDRDDIKEAVADSAQRLVEECKQIRRETNESERRIVEHIDRLFERRFKERA